MLKPCCPVCAVSVAELRIYCSKEEKLWKDSRSLITYQWEEEGEGGRALHACDGDLPVYVNHPSLLDLNLPRKKL